MGTAYYRLFTLHLSRACCEPGRLYEMESGFSNLNPKSSLFLEDVKDCSNHQTLPCLMITHQTKQITGYSLKFLPLALYLRIFFFYTSRMCYKLSVIPNPLSIFRDPRESSELRVWRKIKNNSLESRHG